MDDEWEPTEPTPYNTVREDAGEALAHARSELEELMIDLEKEADAIAALPQESPRPLNSSTLS